MDFTWKEILIAVFGSGGTIGGLIMAFTLVSARLDARRKRLQEAQDQVIHESVEAKKAEIELKRLTAEVDGKKEITIIDNLWKMIAALEQVVRDKTKENAELEAAVTHSTISPKQVHEIYTKLRLCEEELDHLNIMTFDQEKTNVFTRRFGRVKELLAETRDILP